MQCLRGDFYHNDSNRQALISIIRPEKFYIPIVLESRSFPIFAIKYGLNTSMKDDKNQKTVGLGAIMTGGARVVQRDRQERDWYPTPPEVTIALLRRFPFLSSMKIWEPCCGDGSMANIFEKFGAETVRSDIHPMCKNATTMDFLTCAALPDGVDAIITNPPYNLAPQFIAKALELKPKFVAMFLKSTFWHAKRRSPLWFQYPPSHILALTWRPDFLGLGAPAMDFAWTVYDNVDSKNKTYYELLAKD